MYDWSSRDSAYSYALIGGIRRQGGFRFITVTTARGITLAFAESFRDHLGILATISLGLNSHLLGSGSGIYITRQENSFS